MPLTPSLFSDNRSACPVCGGRPSRVRVCHLCDDSGLVEPAVARTARRTLSRQLRDEVVDRVVVSSAAWQVHAEDILGDLIAEGGTFTSDDLRDRLKIHPPHPRAVGAAFRLALVRGSIVYPGRAVASRHPSTHGRIVREWRPASPDETLLILSHKRRRKLAQAPTSR